MISPLGVYEAPWISATAIVHISLVEAIRVGENRIKKSNCWFRVGVTDSTWRSPLDMAVSPMDRQTPVTACQGEGFPPSRETNKDAEGNINVSELKAINEPDSDLDSGSELPSASVSESKQEETTEEEFDDLLVLQYIDNAVAKFIVDADNNWVDAAVVRTCVMISDFDDF